MFDFFVLLTNEKKNTTQSSSQNTITNINNNKFFSIPEVMQLCDNLIACEKKERLILDISGINSRASAN